MTAETGGLIGGGGRTEIYIRGSDARQKILCPKWAEILLRKKVPYLTRGR